MKQPRVALVFSQSHENATLSYQHGWPSAFVNSTLFHCEPFNLAGISFADEAAIALSFCREKYDAIILLHSVFSNQKNLRRLVFLAISLCKSPKVFFIGNEYKLMPEKMRFCRDIGVDLLISQSNDPKVLLMYRQFLACEVESIPNTGFDENVFYPSTVRQRRNIDIGYRAFLAPWYLGNNEKSEIANLFTERADEYQLNVDISFDPARRFGAADYAAFLNQCRGQIGTEAGGDYFELTDNIRKKVNNYLETNTGATWLEVKSRFFDSYTNAVPMRIISGRQIEAAACKTVQILYAGRYSGYLDPDQHYIPLSKDGGNLSDVLEKFRDDSYCEMITSSAYDVAMSEFTYQKLIAKFYGFLSQLLS